MGALPTVLVQIAVILLAGRTIGWLFARIHQPQVIGEMVAGILLGPSLLGWLAPGVSATVFPASGLNTLNILSQLGLLLFMFLVGLELDPQRLRGRGHTTVMISHASIILPFCLGIGLAFFLYPRLSDGQVPFLHFALFFGLALSITAFPVLARILAERDLLRTHLGAVAISCAAVDDITAWCILAGVVALVRASASSLPFGATVVGALAFVGLMLFGMRPALRRLETAYRQRQTIAQGTLALVCLLILASAWTTEMLGIHALFGAFLAGVVMPKDPDWVHALTAKLADLVTVLLLPLFFAYSGLRTSVRLVSGPELWAYFGLILLVAVGGKFGGSALAARVTGLPWAEAGALGILMNTRGLIELVALNVGLDLGLISPTLFTMMVLMALVTTFMTTPLLAWTYLARRPEPELAASVWNTKP